MVLRREPSPRSRPENEHPPPHPAAPVPPLLARPPGVGLTRPRLPRAPLPDARLPRPRLALGRPALGFVARAAPVRIVRGVHERDATPVGRPARRARLAGPPVRQ